MEWFFRQKYGCPVPHAHTGWNLPFIALKKMASVELLQRVLEETRWICSLLLLKYCLISQSPIQRSVFYTFIPNTCHWFDYSLKWLHKRQRIYFVFNFWTRGCAGGECNSLCCCLGISHRCGAERSHSPAQSTPFRAELAWAGKKLCVWGSLFYFILAYAYRKFHRPQMFSSVNYHEANTPA